MTRKPTTDWDAVFGGIVGGLIIVLFVALGTHSIVTGRAPAIGGALVTLGTLFAIGVAMDALGV